MSNRTASWPAWAIAALSVIMFVAAIALHVLARAIDSPGQWSTLGAVGRVLRFRPSSPSPWWAPWLLRGIRATG